ncbi:MAG: type ISP restriction/modification enzyme [Myxococcota bacterium]
MASGSERLTDLEARVAKAAEDRMQRLEGASEAARRGVVHTPPALCRAVVQRVDEALRAHGLAEGLTDPRVVVLDPACGPGAFLAAVLSFVADHKGRPGQILGHEIDPVTAEVAEGLLRPVASELGVPLRIAAKDSLLECRPPTDAVVAVLGNPPWSSRAGESTPELRSLLDDFRRDERGEPLGERKLGVLSDDYVRFVRWAAELLRRSAAGGALGLVTNGSYLDGPVHRGMRGALLRWFDAIDIFDLGGGSLTARNGSPDENVFGVRPPAAVLIGVRGSAEPPAIVRYARIRGDKQEKLARLANEEPSRIEPREPGFYLRATRAVPAHYETWLSLSDAMPFHREGVQTNRDAVVVDDDREALLDRLRRFADGRRDPDLGVALDPLPHYDPAHARERVAEALRRDPRGTRGFSLRALAYRPFAQRWFCPVAPLCHRPRRALLRAMDQSPLALITVRKDRGERQWSHVGLSRAVPDNCWLSSRSSCRARAFPSHAPDGGPNLSEAVEGWAASLSCPILPVDFIAFVAAVLSTPTYQATYDEALRRAYPRIPKPPSKSAFLQTVDAGHRLAEAFLRPRPEPLLDPVEAVAVGHREVKQSALIAAQRHAARVVDRWLSN